MRDGKIVKNKKGFSLVESLASSIILAIGLFAVGVALYTQFSSINQNREKAIASLAAQEEIENVRGMSFDDILALGTSFTATGFAYLGNPVGTINIDDIYGDANIRRVSITVQWNSANGSVMQKKLATLVTRNGIDKQ